MVLGKSIGRLPHTIDRVCQSAYERGKPGSAAAVLKRLPVMVLGKSIGSLLHTIGGSVSQHTSEASLVQQ